MKHHQNKQPHQLSPRKDTLIEGHLHITTRYCAACGVTREFHYNPEIKHSQCIVCGGRKATRATIRRY